MKQYFINFIVIVTCFFLMGYANGMQIPKPRILQNSKQLIVVVTPNWSSTQAKLQRYQRSNVHDSWKLVGKAIPAIVGKTGLAWADKYKRFNLKSPYKKEGDAKSPAGVFTLGPVFGFKMLRSNYTKNNFIKLKPTTICVDAINSKYYGEIINSSDIKQSEWIHGEHMFKYKHFYQYGIVVNYNNQANKKPGAGSCIFLHVWKGTSVPTVGCTAMPKKSVITIIKWLKPKAYPVLVQLPKQRYNELHKVWGLPDFKS